MSSLTLTQLADSTYYIPSPSNVGLYAADGQAVLIDSGSDREAALTEHPAPESTVWYRIKCKSVCSYFQYPEIDPWLSS